MKIRLSTAVILNAQGEILMMLRDNKPGIMHPGKWGLIGGHSEKRESSIKTLIREVKEETGLKIDKGLCGGPIIIHGSDKRGKIKRSVFVIKGNWTDGDIIKGEGQEIKFISRHDFPFLEVSPHVFTIFDAVGLKLKFFRPARRFHPRNFCC